MFPPSPVTRPSLRILFSKILGLAFFNSYWMPEMNKLLQWGREREREGDNGKTWWNQVLSSVEIRSERTSKAHGNDKAVGKWDWASEAKRFALQNSTNSQNAEEGTRGPSLSLPSQLLDSEVISPAPSGALSEAGLGKAWLGEAGDGSWCPDGTASNEHSEGSTGHLPPPAPEPGGAFPAATLCMSGFHHVKHDDFISWMIPYDCFISPSSLKSCDNNESALQRKAI